MKISGFAVKFAARTIQNMAEPGQSDGNQCVIPALPAIPAQVMSIILREWLRQSDHASAVRPVSVSGAVPGAATSAGFQLMGTKRGSCSTRFSQAFTEG